MTEKQKELFLYSLNASLHDKLGELYGSKFSGEEVLGMILGWIGHHCDFVKTDFRIDVDTERFQLKLKVLPLIRRDLKIESVEIVLDE